MDDLINLPALLGLSILSIAETHLGVGGIVCVQWEDTRIHARVCDAAIE